MCVYYWTRFSGKQGLLHAPRKHEFTPLIFHSHDFAKRVDRELSLFWYHLKKSKFAPYKNCSDLNSSNQVFWPWNDFSIRIFKNNYWRSIALVLFYLNLFVKHSAKIIDWSYTTMSEDHKTYDKNKQMNTAVWLNILQPVLSSLAKYANPFWYLLTSIFSVRIPD